MYFSWPKLQTLITDNIQIDNLIVTLIQHNEPLLFVTKNNSKYFLNYLIDEDEVQRRFLYVPISHMSLRALVTRGISLFECLKSENLFLYDLNINSQISFTANVDFDDISEDALPAPYELLPELSQNVIEILFDFESTDLCFILSGENLDNHTMSFDKLSKFLLNAQKVSSEATNYYCLQHSFNIPFDTELRVTTHQAASFAINTYVKDDVILDAINEVIPTFTQKLLTSNSTQMYNLLDSIPTSFAQSLFTYFNTILSNKYESIIKIKNQSFYLNTSRILRIKENVNNANYIREETINSIGYLVGGNIKTNYFYFVDKENGITYKGRISEEYSSVHESKSLFLSDQKIQKAKFRLSIEFKFSKFNQFYELLELSDVE